MLIGMPIASTMGLLGSPKKPMIIPWLLNRNGQAITLNDKLKGKVGGRPEGAEAVRRRGARPPATPLTFAMTFPPGTHAMWMRYWLARRRHQPGQGRRADRRSRRAQMVANMKVGKMDGFCVGEPWNARAIADGIGFTAITTQDIWKDHPEKVCAFTAEFAEKNPEDGQGRAQGAARGERVARRHGEPPEQARSSRAPTYINCPPEMILGRLQGHYDYGDGRKKEDPNYMIFSEPQLQLPAAEVRARGGSRSSAAGAWCKGAPDYAGRRQAGHAAGHLRGGDEGDRRHARRRSTTAGDAVRRRDVRPGRARGVRAGRSRSTT